MSSIKNLELVQDPEDKENELLSLDEPEKMVNRIVKLQINYEIEIKTLSKQLEQQNIELKQENQKIANFQKEKYFLSKQLEIEKQNQKNLIGHLENLKDTLKKIKIFSTICGEKFRLCQEDKLKTDNQIVEFNNQLNNLKNQFHNLYEKHLKNQEMYKNVQDKYEATKVELETLQDNFQEVSKQLNDSKNKIDFLTNDNIKIKYTFDDLFKTYNELNSFHCSKVEELNTKLINSKNKIEEVEKLYKVTESDLLQTKDAFKKVEEDRDNLMQNENNLHMKLYRLEQQYRIEIKKNEDMEKKNSENEVIIESLKTELNLASNATENISKKFEDTFKSFELEKAQLIESHALKVEESVNSKIEMQEALERKIKELGRELNGAKRDLISCQSNFEESMKLLKDSFERKINCEEEEHRKTVLKLESLLENEKTLRQTTETDSAKNLDKLQQEFDKLENEFQNDVNKFKLQIDEAKDQFLNEKKKIEENYTNQLNEKNLEIERIKKEKKLSESKFYDLQMGYEKRELQFQGKIMALQHNSENLEKSLNDLVLKFKTEKDQLLDEFHKNLQKKSDVILENEKTISDFDAKIKNLSEQFDKLQKNSSEKILQYESEIVTLNNKVISLEKAIEQQRLDHVKELEMMGNDKKGFYDEQIRLRKNAENTVTELRKQFDEKIKNYQNKIRNYESDIANLNQTKDDLFKKMDVNYTKMREEFSKRLDEKSRLYEQQCDIVANYQKKCTDLEKQVNDFIVQINLLKNDFKLQSKQNDDLNADLNSKLKNELEKNELLNRQIEYLKEQHHDLVEKLHIEQAKCETEKNQHQHLISEIELTKSALSDLKETLKSQTLEYNELKLKHDDLLKENGSIRNELINKQKSIEAVKKEEIKLKNKQDELMESTIKKYTDEITELRSRLDKKQSEIDELKLIHDTNLKNLETRMKKEKTDEIDRFFQAMQGRFKTLELQQTLLPNLTQETPSMKRNSAKTEVKTRSGEKRFKELK